MQLDYTLEIPENLLFFITEDWRYKVAYGGRGGGKSHSIAQALLHKGIEKPLNILCGREIQKSIKQSVHKLLKDWINRHNMTAFYEVQNTQIIGANGTQFSFTGLQDHTTESIKSYEAVDIFWGEEAKNFTDKSLNMLIPTIRKSGSQIWLSFNPELESDPVYQRYVLTDDEDVKAVKVNYYDNPWHSDESEKERLRFEKSHSELYRNVWLGECLPAVEGAIYHSEISAAENDKRIREIPYDPNLKVHTVWDFGFNDSMVIGLVQKSATDIRILRVIEDSQRTLSDYIAELKEIRFSGQRPNWGDDFIPHDGFSKDFKSGTSAEAIMRKLGRNPVAVSNIAIEEGIRSARDVFPMIYFDRSGCQPLIEALKRYRRHVNQRTGEPGKPLHDSASHCADMFRYLAICHKDMRNENSWPKLSYPKI